MIEQTILNNLIQNEEYVRKVIPYLKAEYFHDYSDRFIFKGIVEYFEKYNKPPTVEAIRIASQDAEDLSETQYESVSSLLFQESLFLIIFNINLTLNNRNNTII